MHQRLFKRETMIFLMFLLPALLSQGSSAERVGKSLILFGDTHVHSQYSVDAFSGSLPIKQGARGAYPPADACDYARYVSQLDFYFLTDHAESYLPEYWQDAINSVQRCSETQDGYNSGLVGFIGWEWSQVGITAKSHFGHHNVLFKDIQADKIPKRPIGAKGIAELGLRKSASRLPSKIEQLDPENAGAYQAFRAFGEALKAVPRCPEGVNTRELPDECLELTATPKGLYRKLDEWGFDTLVIPHGSAWGMYTPPGSSWETALTPEFHDADKSRLIEIYSGHGNSEVYRNFRARPLDKDGKPFCPEPQENYLPACWQAGEIIRARCLNEEGASATLNCDARAKTARDNFIAVAHVAGWKSIAGSSVEEWLDAGQARDVYMPAFNYRPMKSAQYGLALRNFEDTQNVLENRWGFIASTDTHTSRAGHGFKEYMRMNSTEAGNRGGRDKRWHDFLFPEEKPSSHSISLVGQDLMQLGFGASESERRASFLSLGGLVAVHANGRGRDDIWNALKEKSTYATTGARISLWFDLLSDGSTSTSMGGEALLQENPVFRVRALGSFKQQPGCPEAVKNSLSKQRLSHLAAGECYHPSDERRKLERIEVVRIRPQSFSGEAVDPLIEDKWKVFTCPKSQDICEIEFTDEDFSRGQRDATYYVRVIEEPTNRVNGNNLRMDSTKEGTAKIDPCYGDYRTDAKDECLAPVGHRAWSSPIFIRYDERT